MSAPLQIAIDGPAASGKTTVARRVAERLGIPYFDTGVMYRALAALALRTQTDADNEEALLRLMDRRPITVVFDAAAPSGQRVLAGAEELPASELQSSAVTAVVSTVAAHPRVRETMVREQRRIADERPIVMAGRDIGTVVLPQAPVKIYLTASAHARARRRQLQLEAAGVDVSAHALEEELRERDRLDSDRPTSPLRAAPDAVRIDSSDRTVDEVVDEICRLAARAA